MLGVPPTASVESEEKVNSSVLMTSSSKMYSHV